MNSAAIARPELVGEIADRFGAQVLVLSLDVKRSARTPSGFVVTTHGGRTETDLDALAWAAEAIERGAGELLVNSIDADGTKQGFDLELIAAIRAVEQRAGHRERRSGRARAFRARGRGRCRRGAAASVFHNGELTVGQVKDALRAEGVDGAMSRSMQSGRRRRRPRGVRRQRADARRSSSSTTATRS